MKILKSKIQDSVLLVSVFLAAESDFKSVGTGVKNSIRIPDFFGGVTGPAGTLTAGGLIFQVVNILLLLVASLSLIFLIVGGYRYVMAHGNEEQSEAAKKTITSAIIGLAVVILSFAVIAIISRILITGKITSTP